MPDRLLRPVFQHKLSEQELDALTPAQQAMAKDWSVINCKIDWLIDQTLNIQTDQQKVTAQQTIHAEQLKVLRMVLKIVGWFIPSGLVMLGAIAWLVKYIHHLWGAKP